MNTITIVGMILGISTLVAALNTILSNIILACKWGNKGITKYVNKLMKPHFDDVHNTLTDIQTQIREIKDENDQREIQRLRYDCLCFASEVRDGVPKKRGEYEEIFRMEQSYEQLIKKHNIENGFMVEEMRYIHEQYRKF